MTVMMMMMMMMMRNMRVKRCRKDYHQIIQQEGNLEDVSNACSLSGQIEDFIMILNDIL